MSLRRFFRCARPARALARPVLVGLLAGTATIATGQVAQAATPPVFPHNIVVFPDRDFVTLEGYEAFAGRTASIIVRRNGVETSRAVGVIGAGDPSLEINHPGGVCWQGVTPNIKPGDVVTARISTPTGVVSDSTRTLSPTVTGFSRVGANRLVVSGRLGAGVARARIEQRIVAPDLKNTDVGRRDVRAPARPGPYTSTLAFPTATTFRATYTFPVDANTTAAEATRMRNLASEGQMRVLSWQAADADGNRQGLTISEFGEVGGPGFGGCPAGPEFAAPNAPTTVTATAGDGSAAVTWTRSTNIVDGAAVTGYRVTAVNTVTNVETSVTTPVCATGCSATVPNLVNGATYRVEVYARSAGGPSAAGVAPGTITPAGTTPRPTAPSAVTGVDGDLADAAVTALAQWVAPAQAAGAALDGWRVTAFDGTTDAVLKRVFLDEPVGAATDARCREITFGATGQVYFKVQAIAGDDAGTLSTQSPASNLVAAQ